MIDRATNPKPVPGRNRGIPSIWRRSVLLSYLVLGLFLLWPAFASAVTLDEIQFAALPGDKVQITLGVSGPVGAPASFSTDTPARVVLDLPGVSIGSAPRSQPVGVGAAHSIEAAEAGGRTRVVVKLDKSVPYAIEVLDDNSIVLTLSADGAVASRAAATPAAEPAASSAPAGRRIDDIDFRRGPKGEGRVLITLSDPSTVIDVREESNRVILDIADTQLPDRLMRRLDVLDFGTPVSVVDVKRRGGNVKVEIQSTGDREYMAYQANELYTVELRPLSKRELEQRKKEKQVYTGERLSLNFQDIEVRAVLQLLADFTGLNLVTSDTVDGRITLRLKNVPWDQALEIILKTKGLSQRRTNNVIMVAPTEELAAREKLELESQQQIEELAPLRSEFIQANYAKAADLAALLKSEENRLLSERGNVTIDERTNTLLVQDTAAKLEDIRRIVEKLDIPVRQVLIESRIVIANNDFAKDLGVRFGTAKRATSGDNFINFSGGNPGHIDGTAFVIENPPSGDEENPGPEALLVNMPVENPAGAINFLIGKAGSYLLQLELSAMQREGRGEVISSPRVITSDQNRASIKQGFEIPYEEASSSGATTVAFKEAVLKLDVTPHITPDNRILMDLFINKDNPDFSNALGGVPPINTRKIETKVLVDDGETVVLGGIYERNKTKNTERVPFFGDLPVVGFLFKSESQLDENKELLIFVTPKILKESLGFR